MKGAIGKCFVKVASQCYFPKKLKVQPSSTYCIEQIYLPATVERSKSFGRKHS